MYGEGLLCMARALAAARKATPAAAAASVAPAAASTADSFSEAAFLAEWKAAFGLCGSFSGYADHTTRTTMTNMLRIAAENEKETFPPKGAPDALKGPLFFGIKTAAAELSGDALAARAAAVAAELGAPEQAAWALAAAAAWDRILRSPVASDDVESNTLGKLVPAAVAAAGAPDFDARVARAIRVTQSHDDVTGWIVPLARAIEAAVLGTATTPRAALDAALPHFSAERASRMREALAAADAGEDEWSVIGRFGASCAVANTAPLTAFMLARHGPAGFEACVRHNMVGDSAARACVLGAVLAALGGGVPAAWLARLDPALRSEAEALAAAVAAPLEATQ